MKPELRRFGKEESPVVIIDDFSGRADEIVRLADALAPFPSETDSYYPGVRRMIEEKEAEAFACVRSICRDASPFIAGAFDVEGFDLLRASFSIVSTAPDRLSPVQRAPHFDSTDQKYFALLHYLRVPAGSGTAFYRQRETAIERVTDRNLPQFVMTAERDAAMLGSSGYIQGSNAFFEQIGAVEGVPDRLVIYQGSLLHSGIIPPGMTFSADPREGRLTCNIFVRGH
ncbi:hypothetical protein GCM10022276_05550 [Sphingomonas limnosediminicola]|uniref:Uncharacterized protein n=1 Tax=Sphingomonas limnosediminicola TaxID=940133 RepID=A0ABP7KW85_9SPHN